ncbi:hypothetical protein [Crenobacter cavernae]|uniref:Uncharacterized protein n=1 Tax=Crenobacter cavernae TaxID=2290923 RepID=A0A345Y6U5_9NEIS|nr:hypothetical protein [Crenobacter cavernae]AXK39647.1 hypothetical protein DWG20_09430 [Crenobacter cavernae]
MCAIDPKIQMHFFGTGMQYYIAARAASIGQLMPVAGNLFHHAVEMLLKGDLTRAISPRELAQKPYSHSLVNAWNKFKEINLDEDLSGFDQIIEALHRFEVIRYPDKMLIEGAGIALVWGAGEPPPVAQILDEETQEEHKISPEYVLNVGKVDALIARLFKVCSINPPTYYRPGPNSEVDRFLQHQNSEYDFWVPSSPTSPQE